MLNRAPGQIPDPRTHGLGVLCQLALVLVAWVYLFSLHWDNDGLWFQGDAPRHAANGVFWKDYLSDFSLDPKSYALSYYARYPVINPIAYPPFFYLLEAPLFALVGPSPYAAKALVLVFALIAALYMTAWLRRWVAEESGWLGSLLLLLPLVIEVSHSVLLNAPALAMALAVLYHARSWLEAPTNKKAFSLFAVTVLAVLTYFQNIFLLPVIGAWIVLERRWHLLWSWPVLVLAAFSFVVLLPVLVLVLVWEPDRVGWMLTIREGTWELSNWLYYMVRLPRLVNAHILALAATGILCGIVSKKWRKESTVLLVLSAVCYACFSFIVAKDHRYILPITIPIVCFCAIALMAVTQWIGEALKLRPTWRRAMVSTALAILLVTQAVLASRVVVPNVTSIKRIVAFVEEKATDGMLFYDGPHRDLFCFFVLAGDPDFQRRVVVGPRLVDPQEAKRLTPEEVRSTLLNRSGCRWLAVEESQLASNSLVSRLVQAAVKDERFQLIETFPISHGRGAVRVYRTRVAVPVAEEVELTFHGVTYKVKPITR